MKTVWLSSASLVLSLVAAGAPVAQQAAQYEHPGDFKPSQVLPASLVRGPHYQVQSPVVGDGYMLRFNVRSDYGSFEVIGTPALRKLVVEIGAIAALREIKTGQAFGDAVVDSGSGPFRFAKSLITNPVDTVTGVPKGAFKLFEDVGDAVTTERNPSDDPAYQKVLLVSGRKRDYAAKLGVDVYSSNPVLQKELNSVGWAAAVGNLTVSAALMPVGGAAGAAITGVRWSNAVNDYLKVEPASRLRIIASDKLKEIGVPDDIVTRFINQPHFTPRQYVVIAIALSQLGPAPARGREEFLEVASLATEEVEANFFTNTAQILRGYHNDVARISEIRMNKRIALAKSANGSLVLLLPVDYLMWTQGVDRRSQELVGANRAAGFTGKVEAWLTGVATPRARQQLGDRGITVVEQVNRRMEIVD
jgi:hypothetical protein